MQNLAIRRIARISLVLAVTVFSTSLLFAQQTYKPLTPRMSDDELLRQYDPGQIREFREDLRTILSNDHELFTLMGKNDAGQYIEKRAQIIDQMKDADLARMMASGVDLQPLMTATDRLRKIVEQSRAEAIQNATMDPKSTGLPGAGYSFCGSTRNSADAMFAAQIVLETAQGVWSVASRACDEVVVILGEGGNTSLVCIIVDAVLFAAETTFHGFEFCDADIDSAEIEGSYQRLGHIHGDLENAETHIVNNDNSNRGTIVSNDNTNKDTIIAQLNANTTVITNAIDANTTAIINNDNANKNTIVANDNSNRTQIINNDNTNRDTIVANDNSNRDLMVGEMRKIGCDMIRLLTTPEGQRSSANTSCSGQPGFPYDYPEKKLSASAASFPSMVVSLPENPVAPIGRTFNQLSVESSLLEGRLVPSYYLPASRGGLIEQVKDLVWNTIQAQEGLGIAPGETHAARVSAAAADEMLTASHFVDAYRGYILAYQTLVPKN